jgi:hypothetical protein
VYPCCILALPQAFHCASAANVFLHRTWLCAVLHCVANASVVLCRDVPFCVMSCQALCCWRTTFCMRSWGRWGQA